MHLTFHLTSLLHLNPWRSVNLAQPASRLHYIHQLSQQFTCGSVCSVCIWKKRPHVRINIKQGLRFKYDTVLVGRKRRFRDLDSEPEGGRKRLRNFFESLPVEWISHSTGVEWPTLLWEPELSQKLKINYVKASACFIWLSAGPLWTLHSGSRNAGHFWRS